MNDDPKVTVKEICDEVMAGTPRSDLDIHVSLRMKETDLVELIADPRDPNGHRRYSVARDFENQLTKRIEDGYGRTWAFVPPN